MTPDHALRNPLADAHLPEPPFPNRPDQPYAHAGKERRRRHEECHAAADRGAAHRGDDGAYEGVFRIPHDPPEDEDADVVQGAEQRACAEACGRVARGGGVAEEGDVLLGGCEGGGGADVSFDVGAGFGAGFYGGTSGGRHFVWFRAD